MYLPVGLPDDELLEALLLEELLEALLDELDAEPLFDDALLDDELLPDEELLLDEELVPDEELLPDEELVDEALSPPHAASINSATPRGRILLFIEGHTDLRNFYRC